MSADGKTVVFAMWDRLYRLKQRGVTLVLTTHYMDEAEQLCDRLVVMDGGRIVEVGTHGELIAAVKDLATMEIVGWSMSDRLKSTLCEDALKMAIRNRQPPTGLIHHSDRGVQYACHEYAAALAAKARAILGGRFAVSVEDVSALARPTLQHSTDFMRPWARRLTGSIS